MTVLRVSDDKGIFSHWNTTASSCGRIGWVTTSRSEIATMTNRTCVTRRTENRRRWNVTWIGTYEIIGTATWKCVDEQPRETISIESLVRVSREITNNLPWRFDRGPCRSACRKSEHKRWEETVLRLRKTHFLIELLPSLKWTMLMKWFDDVETRITFKICIVQWLSFTFSRRVSRS